VFYFLVTTRNTAVEQGQIVTMDSGQTLFISGR